MKEHDEVKIGDFIGRSEPREGEIPQPLVPTIQTLLSAVSVVGPGTGQTYSQGYRNSTIQVTVGGATPDNNVNIRIEGSLDNTNWFSLGGRQGPGLYSENQHTVAYIRANVIAIASGTVTVLACSS